MLPGLDDLSFKALHAWAEEHGARLVIVLVAALIANVLLRRVVPRAVRTAILRESSLRNEADLRKRADTLGDVIVKTAGTVVLLICLFVGLDELGYNVAPFLTGLGIGGVALGLGSQSLVRDMITGIFILVENQYGKGDLVQIAGVQGWVEDVNLRRTVLRDADGTLFTVPNSEVKVAGNLTRGFSGINMLVPLAYAGDLERAIELVDQAGRAVAGDARLTGMVLDAPYAARVESLTDKGVMIRVLGKVAPGAQFEVAGALRRRLKALFDEAGIRFVDPPVPAPPAGAPAGAAPLPGPRATP